jgi:hypothetical protein
VVGELLYKGVFNYQPPWIPAKHLERFNERARQVLAFAQEEAHSILHNYVGTEHLLLGLLREREDIAGQALAKLGVTLELVRAAVENKIGTLPLRSFAVSMSNFLTSFLSSILPPLSVFLPRSIISGSGRHSKRRETDANGSTACYGDPLRALRLRSSWSHDCWSPYCAHSVTTSSPFGRKNCIPEGPTSSHSASS